ncbi:exported protein of unknown function [Brevefilum fermentans]|uniref:Uncharacterized protein n=1 Tax=Candidatus Brevifilum fermentans TaxID=1986204 RepID=A0A1Y6K501_9CHLR|nr:exported protein of unknown function [Brevefilum fermentans]
MGLSLRISLILLLGLLMVPSLSLQEYAQFNRVEISRELLGARTRRKRE